MTAFFCQIALFRHSNHRLINISTCSAPNKMLFGLINSHFSGLSYHIYFAMVFQMFLQIIAHIFEDFAVFHPFPWFIMGISHTWVLLHCNRYAWKLLKYICFFLNFIWIKTGQKCENEAIERRMANKAKLWHLVCALSSDAAGLHVIRALNALLSAESVIQWREAASSPFSLDNWWAKGMEVKEGVYIPIPQLT